MKNLTMQYKITEKFVKSKSNPYHEDTRTWHTWIDLSVMYDGLDLIDIDSLAKYHAMDISYYEDTLSELCEDGYIEAIYEIGEIT